MNENEKMVLGPKNYALLICSVGLVISGFMLMSGGEVLAGDFDLEIFSFRRITLAPIVVISGYVLGVYAIMLDDSSHKKEHA